MVYFIKNLPIFDFLSFQIEDIFIAFFRKVDIKKKENNESIHWKLVIPISSKNCCDEVCKKYQELKDFHTNGKPPNQCIGYTYHTTGRQCMIKSTVKSSQRTEKANQTGR